MDNSEEFKLMSGLLRFIPFDFVVKKMVEDANNFLKEPNEETKNKLVAGCQTVFVKATIDDQGMKAFEKIVDEIDERNKVYDAAKEAFEEKK